MMKLSTIACIIKNAALTVICCTLFTWNASCSASNGGTIELIEGKLKNLRITSFRQSGEFTWCGEKHLAISKHSRDTDAGIRLLDIDDGQIRRITTNKAHRVLACTPDGRHLFFVENGVHGTLNELDIVSGKHQIIYSKNIFKHEAITEAPISPTGEYLLGPSELGNEIRLSDRVLKVLHVPKAFSSKFIEGATWSRDGTAYVIFGSDLGDSQNGPQKLLILKSGDVQMRVVDMPRIRNTQFTHVWLTENKKRLYLLGADEGKLYELAPPPPHGGASLKQIANMIEEVSPRPNGGLFLIKNSGVNYSKNDRAVIDKSARRSLLLMDDHGRITELLRVPYLILSMGNIKVSPRGGIVAIGTAKLGDRNNSDEILVLRTSVE